MTSRKSCWMLVACCALCAPFTLAAVAADPIPALAKIPSTLLSGDQDEFQDKRRELEAKLDAFREEARRFNAVPASEHSASGLKDFEERQDECVEAVRIFNHSVQEAMHQRTVSSVKVLGRKLKWNEERLAHLDGVLDQLNSDRDPATEIQVQGVWKTILARTGSDDLAKEAAAGSGPGFTPPGSTPELQNGTVAALAAVSGMSYRAMMTWSTDLIRRGDWHDGDDHADTGKVLAQRGLNGPEIVLLAETLGQSTIVPESEFVPQLAAGNRIFAQVVASPGDIMTGHVLVLVKSFRHGGETWLAVADSVEAPGRPLYLSTKELATILQQQGIVFRLIPKTR